MSIVERFLITGAFAFLVGSPLYLPWVFARTSIYKSWYIGLHRIGVSFRNAVYMWPFSFVFLIMPVLVFIEDENLGYDVWGKASMIGIFFGFYLMAFPPRWAKPWWVKYLEDNYSKDEINKVFCPAWREYRGKSEIDSKDWWYKMNTEEGIKEMVVYARQKSQ